jgi:dienelactone hydrolase
MKRSLKIQTTKFVLLFAAIGFITLSCTAEKERTSYSAGFSCYKAQDSSRLYIRNQDTVLRPMLIYFWYPSEDVLDGNKMTFRQYVDLISIREDYSKAKEDIDNESFYFIDAYAGFAKGSFNIGLNTTTEEILDSPVEASLNIPQAKGEFPLIIYAPSNSKTPVQNHRLCEQLAKNGFYVISVASAGENSIQRRDPGKSILAQVEDMEFILDYIEKTVPVRYSSIGLFGYSTGGLAAALFQMKHPDVKAVCSLDGSQEYSFYIFLSKLQAFDLEKTQVPYFMLVNKDVSSVYPFYNSIKSRDKLAVRMSNLDHFGFVSFWSYFNNCKPDSIQNNYARSYDFIADYATTFFDATLKENQKSKEELLSLSSQKNDFSIPDQLDFAQSTALLNTYLQSSIDTAIAIYKSHKAEAYNNYNYREEEISMAGRMLVDYDVNASVKLFKFNIEEYPDSWHAYYDLGFAHKISGEMDQAKEALLKAQQMNPDNMDISQMLSELSN